MKLYETINAENWHQGDYESPDGRRYCLAGHGIRLCILAPAHSRRETRGYKAIMSALRVLFPERGNTIADFNDHPDTTVEDVIRVCKVADV